MTNEMKRVPELRFPEFDEEWEENTIENLLKERNERSGDGQMLSVTINDGIVKFNELDRKDNSSKDKSNYKIVRKNDIAYNSMRMWQGASGKSDYDGIVSPAYTVVSPFKNVNSTFIAYLFKTYKMIHVFKINSQGLTSDTWNLKYKQLKDITIKLPIFEEQEKIGTFFNKLDQHIELEEKKLELLQQQKRGYMQKIFSQEIRFKDENGNDYPDWKEQKLEELGRLNSGVGFPEKYQGGNLGTPFFKVSDMNLPANKTFMNMANNYVTDQQINEKKWKVINDVPAVIFAKVGAAIMLNRKRMVIEPFLMDNNTMSYSFSNHWDTNFGNIFFQTLNLPKYAQVGALPSYNSKDIGTISVNLPSLSEQQKIGDFFIKIDNFIEKQSDKVELLKERKKGFLQKMFI